MKQVLIKGGGDWNDASAVLISVPSELNMKSVHFEYRKWIGALPPTGNERWTAFLTFEEWLKKNYGAQESDVEEFWEE